MEVGEEHQVLVVSWDTSFSSWGSVGADEFYPLNEAPSTIYDGINNKCTNKDNDEDAVDNDEEDEVGKELDLEAMSKKTLLCYIYYKIIEIQMYLFFK